jgi:TPR repeat protein
LGLLSDAQKKVLSELAFIWDAANVEELVPKCNMEGKVISALLNQLTDIRYVEKIKTKNKNNLYRLEERFFNLWFNMTQGGLNNRAKAKALTDFLEKWYDKTALNDLCLELTFMVNRGEANKDYIESMSQALLGSEFIVSKYKQALTFQLSSKGFVKELGTEASHDTGQKNISEAFANKEYQKVITLLENAKIEEGLKYFRLGLAYQNLNDLINAEKYYLLAIEKGVKDALNNLALLYDDQGKAEQAEKYYHLAIEKGNIKVLNNLANLYYDQGKEEQAEKNYHLAIEKGDIDALYNLAVLLYIHHRKSELMLLVNRQPKAIMDGFINENLEFAVLTFLYIGDFDSFKTLSDKLLSDKKALSSTLLRDLLIHRQYHWVYKYFTAHEEMIETYNPLYYATLHLIGDKDQEILKMPPEIKESVESILDSIKKGQEFYGM